MLVPANIEAGDVTEILCIIKRGTPPITFKWLHNGREINSHTKYKISTTKTSSHLHIGEIVAADIGNFTCAASNSYGTDTKTESVSMEGNFFFFTICKIIWNFKNTKYKIKFTFAISKNKFTLSRFNFFFLMDKYQDGSNFCGT